MARDANGFTPTQARIMAILGDGNWHSRTELWRAIDDTEMDKNARDILRQHIGDIKKIVQKRGYLVLYSLGPTNGLGCQLVQKVIPAEI